MTVNAWEDPGCAPGRAHRWSRFWRGLFSGAPIVEECDCGLIRLGTPCGGDRSGPDDLNWNYYRRIDKQ